MDKWYAKNQGTIWIITTIVISLVYAYSTFATVAYVDTKHQSVMDVLSEIRTDVREIRANESHR